MPWSLKHKTNKVVKYKLVHSPFKSYYLYTYNNKV